MSEYSLLQSHFMYEIFLKKIAGPRGHGMKEIQSEMYYGKFRSNQEKCREHSLVMLSKLTPVMGRESY